MVTDLLNVSDPDFDMARIGRLQAKRDLAVGMDLGRAHRWDGQSIMRRDGKKDGNDTELESQPSRDFVSLSHV